MGNGTLLFVAAGFESAALYALIRQDGSLGWFIAFLALNGLASGLLSPLIYGTLPRHYRVPRLPVLGFIAVFLFFTPVLGWLGLLIAVMVFRVWPAHRPDTGFGQIALDAGERLDSRPGSVHQVREAAIAVRLRELPRGSGQRLTALHALRSLPSRAANPVLREMLGDPQEDVRLLAYGMIDEQEKRLNAAIQHERQLQRAERIPAERRDGMARLAALYWELVYNGLAQGDLREHALTQALRSVEAAQALGADDAGLWFLKGRLLQVRGAPAARDAFNRALACGMPRSRVLPYLAELAFNARRFGEVRDLLSEVPPQEVTPRLRPIVAFWSGREVTA